LIAPAPLAIAALASAPFVGSFVGLVADRLPRGEPLVLGRSICRDCGTTLAPPDLVPLLSWMALRGRCRFCRAPIGLMKPVTELAALAVALCSVLVVPDALIVPSCLLGWALLALALIDFECLVLPDRITLPLGGAGLALHAWRLDAVPVDFLIGAAAGWGSLAAVALAYRGIRRRDGLGWGDVKLFAVAGAWVGWMELPSVLLLGALIGIAGAMVTALRRDVAAETRLPFGPALAAAIWITWLCGPLSFA
jgi:leader peptidase (prepilin peptidase)/N-methyltransferase